MPNAYYYKIYKERDEHREKKPKASKQYNRKTWLRTHPEDLWLDRENQQSRKTGYADDDIRSLMAGICLRACIDYKAASTGVKIDGYLPEKTIHECREFFQSEMFQWFVNGLSTEEIERRIRQTPKGRLHNMWKAAIK